ncbi:hypothetical protein HU755_19640 [Pseudomonas sp. SWRI111]|uniref:hypothetical protein n=1 Tax=Pseudomonas sp. SWRI111 TaxID=2745507 RepID=UPI001648B98F|nr:hypothetical protein [Pseudomonas sp. SWRI111]MBC3209022.1 hypothetical protein [Pseudomonas sp. SWRI111]
MDIWQVVSQVTDWLVEKHGTRGRSNYNYMYVVSVAAGVGSWVVSKELLGKRKKLKAKVAQDLQAKPISVSSFTQQNGRIIKTTGTLVRREGVYTVTVVRQDDGTNAKSSSGPLHSLDDVDVYLRAHTSFILADFRIQVN